MLHICLWSVLMYVSVVQKLFCCDEASRYLGSQLGHLWLRHYWQYNVFIQVYSEVVSWCDSYIIVISRSKTNKCFTTMELLNECQMHIQSQINTQEYNYLLRTSGSVELVGNLAGFLEFLFSSKIKHTLKTLHCWYCLNPGKWKKYNIVALSGTSPPFDFTRVLCLTQTELASIDRENY